jgi:type I site-specific restriction endonuclease
MLLKFLKDFQKFRRIVSFSLKSSQVLVVVRVNSRKNEVKWIRDQLLKLGWEKKYIEQNHSDLPVNPFPLHFILFDTNQEPLAIVQAVDRKRPFNEVKSSLITAAHKLQINNLFVCIDHSIILWELDTDESRTIYGFFTQADLERKKRILNATDQMTDHFYSDLRHYQREAISVINKRLNEGARRISLNLSPGAGKHIIMMHMIASLVKRRKAENILILVDSLAEAERIEQGIQQFSKKNDVNISGAINVVNIQRLLHNSSQDYSIGFFDFIFIPEAQCLLSGLYVKAILSFDSVIIGFSSIPFNILRDEHLKKKLASELFKKPDFTFDMDQAVSSGDLSPYQIISLHDQLNIVLDQNQDKKMTETFMNEIVSIIDQKTRLKCLFSPSDEKSIIFASTVYEATLITELLNQLHPEYSGNYAKAATANNSWSNTGQIIHEFMTESAPFFLVSVNLLENGFEFDNITQIFICREVKSRVEYFQMISRGLRQRNRKKITIYDFFNHKNPLQVKPDATTKKEKRPEKISVTDEVAEIFEKWRIEKATKIEYGLKGESLAKEQYIRKWETTIEKYMRKRNLRVPQTKQQYLEFFKAEQDQLLTVLRVSNYNFSEENLNLAYEMDTKQFIDFIWMAIKKDKRFIEIEDINESFHSWVKARNFNPHQIVYLSFIKNILINNQKTNARSIQSGSANQHMNIWELGEFLFDQEGLDQIAGELSNVVFTNKIQ